MLSTWYPTVFYGKENYLLINNPKIQPMIKLLHKKIIISALLSGVAMLTAQTSEQTINDNSKRTLE
jgi:hypothetical protein